MVCRDGVLMRRQVMTAIGWGSAGRPGRHNGAVGVAGVRVKLS